VLGFSVKKAVKVSRGGRGEVGLGGRYVIWGLFGGKTRRVVRSNG
jgi:hypothetical protein